MREENNFKAYFELVGLGVPLILGAIFVIVWAIVNWKKASTPALIAAVTGGVLVFFSCIFPAAEVWLPQWMIRGADLQAIGNRLTWLRRGFLITEHLCWGASLAALGVAAFLGRDAFSSKNDLDKKKRDRDDEEDEDRPRKKRRDREDDDQTISDKPMPKKRPRDDDED